MVSDLVEFDKFVLSLVCLIVSCRVAFAINSVEKQERLLAITCFCLCLLLIILGGARSAFICLAAGGLISSLVLLRRSRSFNVFRVFFLILGTSMFGIWFFGEVMLRDLHSSNIMTCPLLMPELDLERLHL